ncbi:hypothetical protein SCLCIDRAFT_763132 [Scleroderma citrinum Foug A]|uniref:Uncharacterized protein n=1 Tax=Scleroderma citrinum Foug A TaxID=1036808 RepID=A0A0C3DRG4_9AGAM|nr:hypothetical protein SCLCIDRAFT_763132 [Scleroderma citrinum Foug A]
MFLLYLCFGRNRSNFFLNATDQGEVTWSGHYSPYGRGANTPCLANDPPRSMYFRHDLHSSPSTENKLTTAPSGVYDPMLRISAHILFPRYSDGSLQTNVARGSPQLARYKLKALQSHLHFPRSLAHCYHFSPPAPGLNKHMALGDVVI